MGHLLIAVALLVFAGLDVVFVRFSDTPTAALTFAVLAYLVLLLLSGAAGGYTSDFRNYAAYLAPLGAPKLGPLRALGRQGLPVRVFAAAVIPVVLLLILAYIPDLDDPLDPSETVQLGSTFAVFWLLMSLALVGAVLGFLSLRTGALEAVLVGGLVVLAQSLISWVKVDASRDAVQLALHTWMVWVSVCLIGAWVGLALRQVGDSYSFQSQGLKEPN